MICSSVRYKARCAELVTQDFSHPTTLGQNCCMNSLTEQRFHLIGLTPKLILLVPAIGCSHLVKNIEHPLFAAFCRIFSYCPDDCLGCKLFEVS